MKLPLIIVFVLLALFSSSSFAQYQPDVCELDTTKSYGCVSVGTGGYYAASAFDFDSGKRYPPPGRSIPIWVGNRSANENKIDTSFYTGFYSEILSGPGTFADSIEVGAFYGFTYVNTYDFTKSGSYTIRNVLYGGAQTIVNITVAEEVNRCGEQTINGCGRGQGDSLAVFKKNIVAVDAVSPISAGFINLTSNTLDTLWFGTAELTQLSGPGNMLGATYQTANKWAEFVDVSFDQAGNYDIEIRMNGTRGSGVDTFSISVVAENSIPEVGNEKSYVVYPNPANDNLFVNSSKRIKSIFVYDLTGKMVSKGVYSNLQNINFPVADLNTGVYVLSIQFQNGTLDETRFVKMK